MPSNQPESMHSGEFSRASRSQGQLYLHGAAVPIKTASAMKVWDGAACSPADADLFFPEKGHWPVEALELCQVCPVMMLCCATFGPVVNDGVVGGQTAVQRRTEPARRSVGSAA